MGTLGFSHKLYPLFSSIVAYKDLQGMPPATNQEMDVISDNGHVVNSNIKAFCNCYDLKTDFFSVSRME